MIKIKFEVDINPSSDATYDYKYGLMPSPYRVRLCDVSSLFAGKIHECLCKNWKTRVKGKDFYDLVFFLSIDASVNLKYLKSKLIDSKYISEDFDLNIESLKKLLIEKISSINFEQAKNDVMPFVKDKSKLDLWSKDFFISIIEKLK